MDASLIELAVSEYKTSQCFAVALLTVLVYHSSITLDKEIKYFWANLRSSISIIYFTNRYIGLLGAICNIIAQDFSERIGRCVVSGWTSSLANLLTIVLVDYILLLRVLAFYHQDKRLSLCLKSLIFLEATLELSILIYGNIFQGFAVIDLMEGITVCGEKRLPSPILDIISWTIPMVYGLLLLILSLCKAMEYWRLSTGFRGFHLVRVIVQDQILYYGFVIACCILRVLSVSIRDTSTSVSVILAGLGNPTLLCVLGGQLLINLKEAGERDSNGGANYTPRSLSDIEFA